jgi:hypothetical protein
MALSKAGTQESKHTGLASFVTKFNAVVDAVETLEDIPYEGAALDAAEIIVGNAENIATAVAMSGDATISNAGVVSLREEVVGALRYLPTVDEAAQTVTLRGDAEVQVTDLDGDPIEEAALVRVWISATDLGAPSATNNTVAVEDGVIIQAVTANAHYLVLTDATGAAEIRVTVSGAGDRYVMVEHGGHVVSTKLEIAVIE